LNGIWEGSGNVICLDLLRVLRREPRVREALHREICVEGSAVLAGLWNDIDTLSDETTTHEQGARHLAERTALALQYSLLLRYAPDFVSDGFKESKLDHPHLTLGTLTTKSNLGPIIERAFVV
jgi:putative acyl-CoA dehydrogenase